MTVYNIIYEVEKKTIINVPYEKRAKKIGCIIIIIKTIIKVTINSYK